MSAVKFSPRAPRRPAGALAAIAVTAVIAGGGVGLAGCAANRPAPVAVDRTPMTGAPVTDAYGRIRLRPGAQVLLVGDSLVGAAGDLPGAKLGSHRAGRAAEAYGVSLKAALAPAVTVIDRTQPGAKMLDTLKLFPATPKPDAIVLSFGWAEVWGQATPMPVPQYANQVRRVLEAAGACGCPLLVVAPAPVNLKAAMAAAAQPYRAAVRNRAMAVDAPVVDPGAGLARVKGAWSDKVHLSARGSRAMANFISVRFAVARPGEPAP